jgi:hypothetical protein
MRHGLGLLVALGATAAALAGCDPSCAELEDDAFALRAKHARCAAGDSCQIVQMADYAGANNCLLAFQCAHALNADADLEAFGERAREIVADYRSCNECAQAGCADPATQLAVCNAAQGTCELVDDPDAGSGD